MEVVIGSQFLAVILSAGAAATITAVVQAYRSLKDGARSDDRDAFAEIESNRAAEARLRARAELERDYWHRRAATLEYMLITKAGVESVPPSEPFPAPEPTAPAPTA